MHEPRKKVPCNVLPCVSYTPRTCKRAPHHAALSIIDATNLTHEPCRFLLQKNPLACCVSDSRSEYSATHCNTHCNTLQHTSFCPLPITHCIALQHTATRCNTPLSAHCNEHTATHCNTLQHTATYCNTLQHTATHYLLPCKRALLRTV